MYILNHAIICDKVIVKIQKNLKILQNLVNIINEHIIFQLADIIFAPDYTHTISSFVLHFVTILEKQGQ